MSAQVLLRGGGRQCETVAGLDHKDTMEYVQGQQVIIIIVIDGFDDDVQVMFDGEPDEGVSDGLTGCYKVFIKLIIS